LKPLGELAEAVQQVSAERLDQRLGTRAWPLELQPVARAFDQMLARLEESFGRLSQFSADLAHELRTPVANIRGEAEVALSRSRSAEEYSAVLESSVAEAERLSGMIDSLLFLARAEAADRQIALTEFDGGAALEKIATYHGTLAEDRQVRIECTGKGMIRADAMLFGRAVSNLIDNALRFVRPGGKIDIVLSVDGHGANVSVSDDGCGIGREDLPHVFDRFYRADKSRSSSGSGLGLAIVKSIMDLHHGSVGIESEENAGTKVKLTFPRR
jgi:two-component system heavy metal sensor histidine kinase CusS